MGMHQITAPVAALSNTWCFMFQHYQLQAGCDSNRGTPFRDSTSRVGRMQFGRTTLGAPVLLEASDPCGLLFRRAVWAFSFQAQGEELLVTNEK
jgi:hypothetical protein